MPWRVTSSGDIASWVKNKMTEPMRVLKEHADAIGERGLQAGHDVIATSGTEYSHSQGREGRIADPHKEKDGPESMYDGLHVTIKEKGKNDVSIGVGWDLSKYRHGYPELQDEGAGKIVGMQALITAQLAMEVEFFKFMNGKFK